MNVPGGSGVMGESRGGNQGEGGRCRSDASGAAADRAVAAPGSAADREEAGAAFGSPRHLACARLVAEGTVLAVRPVPGAGRERIALAVTRVHRGDDGDRVAFVLDAAGWPRLRGSDRVMVGLPPGATTRTR